MTSTRKVIERPMPSAFEKHAQTVIAAAVLALLMFVGNTMLDVRTQSTRTDAQLTALRESFSDKLSDLSQQVSSLKQDLTKANEDKFRSADAQAAFTRRDITLDDHEKRLRELENRFAAKK